jgi:cholesterol transport system auxiliary component
MTRRTSISLKGAAVAVAGAALLGGCQLLSTPDPVQLYRFGDASVTRAEPAIAQPTPLVLRRVEFPDAVREDRLLGVTGAETAYIKGARWVSDAAVLYTDSLEQAFETQAQRVRLLGRRDGGAAQGRVLDLDVRTFEARYEAPGAAPSVTVVIRARLLDGPSRAVVAERSFSVSQPTAENRVSAIVSAFDVAVRDVNTQIVAWADANAGA